MPNNSTPALAFAGRCLLSRGAARPPVPVSGAGRCLLSRVSGVLLSEP